MRSEIDDLIFNWWSSEGGNFHSCNFGEHSKRLLREVVELCMACGISVNAIKETVQQEGIRHDREMNPKSSEALRKQRLELSDVYILLAIMRVGLAHENGDILQKLKVNLGREWEADEDGVLWRPKS